MSRLVNFGCAMSLAVPLATAAQTYTLQRRALGEPVGIAVPSTGIAAVEEPTALAVNPAGIGFVEGVTLQYFHEGRSGTDRAGDGFWIATPIGPLVPGLSMQWIRPEDGGGARFRKTTFGLALPVASIASFAAAVNWYASPDSALDRLWSLDAGVTIRPWRHLSLGAAVLGIDASLAGRRLPVQYGLGVATRLWRDRLTLSADLLADDRGRDDLTVQATAFAVGFELPAGLVVQAQVQLPVRGEPPGPLGSSYGQLALSYNLPHVGATAGLGGGDGASGTWLVGGRLSTQPYLAMERRAVPEIDVAQALSRPPSLLGGERDRYEKLVQLLAAIRDDQSEPALVVKIDDLPVGHGRIDELRALLLQVRSRKPVVAYVSGGGMKEYYLASAASLVLVPPSADLFPSGVSSSTLFVKETLGSIGVRFDVIAVGRYKTAPEPLVRDDMSEAQREVTASILDDVFARQIRGIAEARALPESRVRELVDVGIFSGDQAVAAHLVDATAWPDELEDAASRLVGERVRLAAGRERSTLRSAQRWGPRHAVALVRVDGTIAHGKSRSDPFGVLEIAGSDTITELIEQAVLDREVVAIVLRVDSPGGDGLASDLIWRAVLQARRAGKPVVASMGDLAASGGYLACVGADDILAEPSTLTGSIGVFALKPDLSGLLGMVGAHEVAVTRGAHADLHSITRPWTAEERQLVERQVRGFYDLFVARVAAARQISPERVDGMARGRVWTGSQAVEHGLVDAIGSLEDAIRLARLRAGYAPDADVEVKPFEPQRSLLANVVGMFGATQEQPSIGAALAKVPALRALALLHETGAVLALPPEWIGIDTAR